MTTHLPNVAQRIVEDHPDLWKAYQQLGEACATSGPLDDRSRRLVKLALALASGSEGAVHSHTRRALEEGMGADEIRQVALLSIPTVGFPAAMAGLSWIEDILRDA